MELKNRVLGKSALPSILSFVDNHNDNKSAIIEVKYSLGTLIITLLDITLSLFRTFPKSNS
mgnify:CR=1 FL=1